MSAEVGENAIDIALKVAGALTSVGAEYFLGGISGEVMDDAYLTLPSRWSVRAQFDHWKAQ
jgi:hypothetical protein